MNWKASLHEIYMLTFAQALTIDEAYRCLLEQQEDRMFSIASALAESKRAQAKVIGAKQALAATNTMTPKSMRRRSEAFLLETNARFMIAQPCMDMARVELGFIQRLIEYIDTNKLRMYSNVFEGAQRVQPMESAYELAWSVVLDPNPSVMRNYLSHPHSDFIRAAVDCIKKETIHDTRVLLSTSLADSFNIPSECLTISVNDVSALIEAELQTTLPVYAQSYSTGIEKLKAIADEHEKPEGKIGDHPKAGRGASIGSLHNSPA